MASITDEKVLKSLGAVSSIRKIKEEKTAPYKPIKYVGFVRVSTQKQGLYGVSQDTQEQTINNYCQQRHYQLTDIYKLVESASKGHRAKFKKFLKYIGSQKDKIAIIVSKIDRLTRQDCNELDEFRKKDKIEIHLIDRHKVLTVNSTPDDLADWEIGVTYSKRESAMIGRRVKENRVPQMEHGQYLRSAPVGYLNQDDKTTGKKTIVVDSEKGHLVKKILLEFATGKYTEKTLCDYAKKLGLTSKKGNYITPGCMGALLHNKFYCGYFTDNDVTYEHIYERLISVETFEKIQRILDKKNKKSPQANKNNSHVYILSNLIKCKCGCQLTCFEVAKNNGNKYRYLFCSHSSTTTPCNVKQVSERVLLDQIKEEVLSNLHVDPEILKIYKPAIKREIQQEISNSKNELNLLQKQKQDIETEKTKALKSLINEVITREEYEIIKEDLDAQRTQIEEKLAQVNTSEEHVETIIKRTMKLLSSGLDAFESLKVTEKNQFLKILLYNCEYDGEKLRISAKKPFDLFLSKGLNQLWQPHSDLNRDSRLERAVS